MTDQPEFDFMPSVGGEPCSPGQVTPAQPLFEWHDVPQARFLSWSEKEQFRYCAARDEHSALYADTDADYMFYKWRAELYRAS